MEPPSIESGDCLPTHITLHPPSDSRKRAVEKFAFTKVFEENTTQLDIFNGTGVVPLVDGVMGEGRDGLVATLGVTGSGKVGHTRGSIMAGLIIQEPHNSRNKVTARLDSAIP